MGYQRKRRLYLLDFTGTPLEGLEIKVRGVSLGKMLSLAGLTSLASVTTVGPEEMEQLREVFDLFVSRIDSWNLEDESGQVIPPSVDEIMGWEPGEALAAIQAWQRAITDVPDPLERTSSGGNDSEVPSILMEGSSVSLPN